MTPYETAVAAFGGQRALARALKMPQSSVCEWRKTGYIPAKHIARVLRIAARQEIELTAEQLVGV